MRRSALRVVRSNQKCVTDCHADYALDYGFWCTVLAKKAGMKGTVVVCRCNINSQILIKCGIYVHCTSFMKFPVIGSARGPTVLYY